MNKNLLKSEIIKNGFNLTTFPDTIGISRCAFYRRLNGDVEFELSEIQAIRDNLHMTDKTFMSIFFNKKVS